MPPFSCISRRYSDKGRTAWKYRSRITGCLRSPTMDARSAQLHDAQLGHSQAQVDQAVGRIAICRVERHEQPGEVRIRGEQAHHRLRVAGLTLGTGLAVGQQALALVLGDEWLHGGLFPIHKSAQA